MRKFFGAAACLVALAACGQTTAPATTETPIAETTPGRRRPLVKPPRRIPCGCVSIQLVDWRKRSGGVVPAGANIRIIQPNTVVTQDFSAARLNVITDANGVVTSLGMLLMYRRFRGAGICSIITTV